MIRNSLVAVAAFAAAGVAVAQEIRRTDPADSAAPAIEYRAGALT